ncbi:MAG: polysaccharide biosynthesis protein [Clostridia bacterium]|nr:polysaccharide biosynthesis protein [Clostridia bacterium]
MAEKGVSSGEIKARGRGLVVSGVLVYGISNILTKVIGLFFKIPMNDLLGDTGMAYFNAAYTVYVLFYMISTAGLPVAVSRLVAESRAQGRFKQVKKIYRLTLLLFFVIGALGTVIMVAFSRQLAGAVDVKAQLCVVALAPTLFLVCLSSAFRGYFQGFRMLVPTGISQVLESLGKLAVGMLLAGYAIEQGKPIEQVAAYGIFGITVGVFAGLMYLWVTKLCFKPQVYDVEYYKEFGDGVEDCDSGLNIVKRLAAVAIPITISSSVMSLASLIDTLVMRSRLESAGIPKDTAVELYGAYSTQCVSLFNLPPVLIYPVAYIIVPLVAECIARREKKRMDTILDSSFRLTAMIALPCAFGMSAIARYILPTLFNSESSLTMAPLLSVLSFAVFFMGVLATSNCALQAAGKEQLPIVSMLAGAAVKLIASFVLCGIPAVNIYGTPISTVLCYAVAMGFNLYFVGKHVGFVPSVKVSFLRPTLSAAACGAVAFAVSRVTERLLFDGAASGRTENALITAVAVVAAVLVYAVLIFRLRAVTAEDIEMLPKGRRIASLCRKLRLLPKEAK